MHPGVILAIVLAVLAAVAGVILLFKKRNAHPVSMESLVGASGVVISRLDNLGGAVLVRGTEWSARAVSEDDIIEEGKAISVVAIEGVKLICKA